MNEKENPAGQGIPMQPSAPMALADVLSALGTELPRLNARVDDLLRENNRLEADARASRAREAAIADHNAVLIETAARMKEERDAALAGREARVAGEAPPAPDSEWPVLTDAYLRGLIEAFDRNDGDNTPTPRLDISMDLVDAMQRLLDARALLIKPVAREPNAPPSYEEAVALLDAYAAEQNPTIGLCDRLADMLARMTTDRDVKRAEGEEEIARLRGIIERDRCRVARALAAIRSRVSLYRMPNNSGSVSAARVDEALQLIDSEANALVPVAVSLDGGPMTDEARAAAQADQPAPEVAYVGNAGPRDAFIHMDTLEAMAAGLAAAVREADAREPGFEVDTPEWARRVYLGAWAAAKAGVYDLDRMASGKPASIASAIETLAVAAGVLASAVGNDAGPMARDAQNDVRRCADLLKRYGIPGMTTAPAGTAWPKRPRAHTAAYAEADVVIDLGGRIVKEKTPGWPNGSTIRVLDERYFSGRRLPTVKVVTDPADPTPSLSREEKGMLLALRDALAGGGGFVSQEGRIVSTPTFREWYLRVILGDRIGDNPLNDAAVARGFQQRLDALTLVGLIVKSGAYVTLSDDGRRAVEQIAREVDAAEPATSPTSTDKAALLALVEALRVCGIKPSDEWAPRVVRISVWRDVFGRAVAGDRHDAPDGTKAHLSDLFDAARARLRTSGLVKTHGAYSGLTDLGTETAQRLARENVNAGA